MGVVRISGPRAIALAGTLLDRTEDLTPRHATLGRIVDDSHGATPSGIDQVVATFFPQPGSYTGEDVVELSAHGSPVLLDRIVSLVLVHGGRLAEPGEFTLRAFLNGRLDLLQAEAVADLVVAVTPLQARVAFDQLEGTMTGRIAEADRELLDLIARLEASLDFPEEGYHFIESGEVVRAVGKIVARIRALLSGAGTGRLIREGCQVVILGKPNVGKSTLFNYLVGSNRAIVAPEAGTTRDFITEVIDLDGLAVDVARTIADEVTGDGGDLVRITHSSKWSAGADALSRFLGIFRDHGRFGRAWADRVDSNAEGPERAGECAGQNLDAAFRGPVSGTATSAAAADTANID